MKNRYMKIGIWSLVTVIVLSVILLPITVYSSPRETIIRTPNDPLLTKEQQLDKWQSIHPDDIVLVLGPDHFKGIADASQYITLDVDQYLQADFNIDNQGDYSFLIEYEYDKSFVQENTIEVAIGNNASIISSIAQPWADATKLYEKDRYGNEIIPAQIVIEGKSSCFITDYSSLDRSPIEFKLDSGINTIKLSASKQKLNIYRILVLRKSEKVTYEDYIKQFDQEQFKEPKLITIEAEDYLLKSDSYIRSQSTNNLDAFPHDTYHDVINILDGNSFREQGQKVMWEFYVEKDGFYNVAFKYNLGYESGMSSFRAIEIDGMVPFKELNEASFPYTGASRYENLTLSSDHGHPFRLWLDKGVHTIAMTVSSPSVQVISQDILALMEKLNSIGMSIKKLSGNQIDKNRTWEIEEYLPGIVDDLSSIRTELLSIQGNIIDIYKEEPSLASNLKYAVDNIEKIIREPKKIPSKLSLLSEGTGSITQILGDIILTLSENPLTIDRIYIYANSELPSDSASIWSRITRSINSFFYSFTDNASGRGYVNYEKDEEALNVWVNRSIQYVQVMQTIIDRQFTKETGIEVKLSIMPNEQKLILSYAAGVSPDMVFGINHSLPYDFAIRGVAKDLLEYDGFLEWYNSEFNINSLSSMCYEDGVYGISETQNFMVLFYRKDILEELGIKVPNTWDDVRTIMPILHQYGMNFNMPIANVLGYKAFFATAPFILQNHGEIYTEDGHATAIDSIDSIKGFKELTDLYNTYAMAINVPDFYNGFRYGRVPIGVSDFGSYLRLSYAAPELMGQWDIAPSPGTLNDKGIIERYQLSNLTAAMIFDNTDKPDQAYKLLKWWMSKEIQVEYAYEMEHKFGPTFKWNTSNIEAFKQLSFSDDHKEVILEQWKWNQEIFRHPASYMIERELSMAYNDVVVSSKAIQESIDKAAMIANREIQRKLKEFGYLDEEGNVKSDYPVDTITKLKKEIENNISD